MKEDLTPIIYKVACQHYHCSDGDDKQYPECKEKDNRLVCPALELIGIHEEIEREKIEAEDKKECTKCDGRGFCLTCDGYGYVKLQPRTKCPECSGSGSCPECDGHGHLSSKESSVV